jgi:HAD superfamily hydrolase (TIGR01490 family)
LDIAAVQLALFDLDHTLIPFDSGSLFTRFLIDEGALPASFESAYLEHCHAYAAGTVDMVAMHRFTVGALAVHEPARLQAWLDAFAARVPPRVPASAHALVARHRDAGHACVMVTATSRLVSQAFAAVLGFDHLLATEPARDAHGRVTGEIIGAPCFREHKHAHVSAWLHARGLGWPDVARSWFYSDSHNDLPLLGAVSHPVAVNPDPTLSAHARQHGWPIETCR